MARLLSIEEICERALRKIGAFAIRSSGARPEEVTEARFWLDMVVAHEAARQRTWWLVGNDATFNLTANNAGPYALNTVLGSQVPDGIQFVIEVIIFDAVSGLDIVNLPMMRRQEWETRVLGEDNKPDPLETVRLLDTSVVPMPSDPPGVPQMCYVDRGQTPTISFYPAPDSTRTYGCRLVLQSFASDFTKNGSTDRTYKLRTSMNLWVVTALAAQIGNGPVRKLPGDEVRDMKQEAQTLRDDLEAYENQEQASEPRRVSYVDF